jgi:hypothetical protein
MTFLTLRRDTAAPKWWHIFVIARKQYADSEARHPGLLRKLDREQLERAFEYRGDVAGGDPSLPKRLSAA